MSNDASAGAKLRMALELSEVAERIQHQNLRRRFPAETESQIRERLKRWLLKRDEPLEMPPGFRIRP